MKTRCLCKQKNQPQTLSSWLGDSTSGTWLFLSSTGERNASSWQCFTVDFVSQKKKSQQKHLPTTQVFMKTDKHNILLRQNFMHVNPKRLLPLSLLMESFTHFTVKKNLVLFSCMVFSVIGSDFLCCHLYQEPTEYIRYSNNIKIMTLRVESQMVAACTLPPQNCYERWMIH